jgi:hypothetical protein
MKQLGLTHGPLKGVLRMGRAVYSDDDSRHRSSFDSYVLLSEFSCTPADSQC